MSKEFRQRQGSPDLAYDRGRFQGTELRLDAQKTFARLLMQTSLRRSRVADEMKDNQQDLGRKVIEVERGFSIVHGDARCTDVPVVGMIWGETLL